MKKIIVAIDGPSSCGKSTIAKELARDVGYVYVDTGAMYRAVALYCLQNGWLKDSSLNEEALKKNIKSLKIEFKTNEKGETETYLNGRNVEKEIRSLEVANAASQISTLDFVRKEMVCQQQKIGKEKGIVMDGRDIGTVVFPEAELKIFLTATPEIRAQRRMLEMLERGEKVTFEEVLKNIRERDERDSHRLESPLKKAEDAIVIDNSNLTKEQQRELVKTLFLEKVLS